MKCDQKSCAACPSAGQKRSREELIGCKLSRIRNKVLVMSGKGGVGKSCVASYLALGLARENGCRVGLLDIDLHGPSIPKMFGLRGRLDIRGHEIVPHEYRPNLKIVSVESMLDDADSAIIWRGPLKHGVIQQLLADCRWDDLDFLVIDSPPGTGDEALSISKLIPDAKALIVTTPQEVALADVRKSINFCRKVGMEILGLVENMSGLFCPHCSQFIPIFRAGGGRRTSDEMKVKFLGELPFDPKVVEGADRGVPVLDGGADTPFVRAVAEFVASVIQTLGQD
ncbi:MAG TPA: Mrp/NBP35 family ATP-binding protein [Syntrophobacteraceae bacterium]|nr:Mrp/NBP35 family ATP-binding protein [Syntrophobacteraceae bacterium]